MKLTNRYTNQTPVWVELASDILLIVSAGTSGYALIQHAESLALISMITGIVGKILARFIISKDEKNTENIGYNTTSSVDSIDIQCGCSEECSCKNSTRTGSGNQ